MLLVEHDVRFQKKVAARIVMLKKKQIRKAEDEAVNVVSARHWQPSEKLLDILTLQMAICFQGQTEEAGRVLKSRF